MTEAEIKQLCPKVERVTLTGDGTIGLKVGEFAQAINVNYSAHHDEVKRQVRNLYNDLLAMNREQEVQINAARKSLGS